jgi:DNA-binding MarR family transcriptional regulator
MTAFHWLVLCCLWQEDGLPTSSIGDKLQQVGGTLTGVLDRMEERGLVRRERDTRDRRIWRIWLTDSGREQSGKDNAQTKSDWRRSKSGWRRSKSDWRRSKPSNV